ncbi:MAG: glycosyltransferase family 9 protein [Gammaproteobacteria bacterium]|nr:glycosyltransferase family 9 protein [Gammaproteobacteria bacterium]
MSSNTHSKNISSICILRLSAIGDVTHMLPIIHSIQKFLPAAKITWVIGTTEYKLVGDLPGVNFIQFNKSIGIKAYPEVLKNLRGQKFDVLLACQVSLRANILCALISANRKIGYDNARAKDFHSFVVNEQINPAQVHVLDSFFQFIEHIGIAHKKLDWSLPISNEDYEFAKHHIPDDKPVLAISPCSSHALRNWNVESYVKVANHAISNHNMHIALLGGNSELEKLFGDSISSQLNTQVINLIGKDTLKQLLAILQRCTALLTPDSGPAHMATCVNTPVLALHAASNSLRSGPYLSLPWCIDKYSEAAKLYFNKSTEQLKWGTKIEKAGVMNLIKPEDVIIKLDKLLRT